MKPELFQILGDAFRDIFAAVPAPIAPEAHAHACLCDACECCAEEIRVPGVNADA